MMTADLFLILKNPTNFIAGFILKIKYYKYLTLQHAHISNSSKQVTQLSQ